MVMNELCVHATQPQPSSDGFATRSPRIYPEGGRTVREEALRLKPGATEERSSLTRAVSRGDRSLETEKRHPPRYFVDDHETLSYTRKSPVGAGERFAFVNVLEKDANPPEIVPKRLFTHTLRDDKTCTGPLGGFICAGIERRNR